MLAITSAKPTLTPDDPYATLMRKALDSWVPVFKQIIYVNQKGIVNIDKNDKVLVVIGEDCPTIKSLAAIAAVSKETYVVIINADIVVNEEVKLVESLMNKAGCRCATSRRWNFSDTINAAKLVPGDNGLDIFIATPEVWEYIALHIPEGLRIGIPGWDNWMVNALFKRYGHSFRNFTRWKCVFHPFHHAHERKFNHDVHLEEITPHIKEL